jgi:hypothetical protein
MARGTFSAPGGVAKATLVGENGIDLDKVKEKMGLSEVKFLGRDLSEVLVQVPARNDL